MFTIAHNALTNASRHAKAGRALVEFDLREDSLRLKYCLKTRSSGTSTNGDQSQASPKSPDE